jgi:hypothetical protein
MSDLMREEDFVNIIRNTNENGLRFLTAAFKAVDGMERYKKDTTPERLAELQRIAKEQEEQRQAQFKTERENAYLEASKAEYKRQKEYLASLTGREKRFFEIIDGVKIERSLGLAPWQLRLLIEAFDNSLVDGSFEIYKYGYLHGQEAEKKQTEEKQTDKSQDSLNKL